MTLRTTRAKKTAITRLTGGYILKVRLIPWMFTKDGVIWLASMAVGKSMRQINDWMMRKNNKRTHQMDISLTGKFGPRTQAIAIRKVRDWMKEIPKGDSITLRCESYLSDKQFNIWKKWFQKHEDKEWVISDYHKSFFFYRAE